MDADLQKFLSKIEENTKALKGLIRSTEENNKKLAVLTEMLDVTLRGDGKAKIKPLAYLIVENNHLLSLIGPDLRILMQMLANVTKAPKLIGIVADMLKPKR
jgi:hypothetical protein